MSVVSETIAKRYVEAGRMRAIATLTSTRAPSFPHLPTLMEKGYPHFNMIASIVISGPKDLPQEITDTWEKSLKVLAKDPQFISACNKVGVNVDLRMGMERLRSMLKEDLERYSRFTPEELGWAKKK